MKDVKSNEGILEWVTIDQVFQRDMPLSAASCLKHYFEVGKYNKSIYVATATDNEEKLTYIFNELSQQE